MKNTLSKIRNVIISNGRRILTVLQYGPKTGDEISPFGIDSSPPDNYSALYVETDNIAEPVIVGYINRAQLAGQGELRLYSLDDSDNIQSFIWLDENIRITPNGTVQLKGNANSIVKFAALNTALENFQNALATELTSIQAGITSAGGTYNPGTLNIDISASENDQVLTN
jgi:hypothetical protein